MNLIKTFLLVILLSPFFLSCKNDGHDIDINKLSGQWVLREAWRNGKQTETLTGTYYFFDPSGVLSTNLTTSGLDEEYEFDISGNKIEQKSSPDQVVYTVNELTDSTLNMKLDIRNIPFLLKLVRFRPDTLEEVFDVQ